MPAPKQTVAQRLNALNRIRVLSRADLCEAGLDTHAITAGVRNGSLIRLRRGWYATEEIAEEIVSAVRLGGRITCLSMLHMIGIFVLEKPQLHVHVPPQLSRSRHRRPSAATVHWGNARMQGPRTPSRCRTQCVNRSAARRRAPRSRRWTACCTIVC
ncbi:type IV toxin-antitoxin system AbiEi family antitoxin domain-containing protein [Microbacterium sp. KUDC0406]|uniref:type IV toxin-antitoxin system AbiEi family antitoxin domain-containing protein n=1 Tax=Microbacterium sp. KUDC0406 TaxID=2909588 RepID=UPI001F259AA6|nr:type IV toxin-antitoxin system AbiEi family antitoxin domain-containing protein [Microbacterium sp. KUDC0406]UJP09486.1 type IV toxin-antitoxin system AbiEi family antitoxin domain-containing protein [Microbacterium sp. KUDC0406]